MHIRPMTGADLDLLGDIDGTIQSTRYLHVDRSGDGLSVAWQLQERPLREKVIESNALGDERRFLTRQIVGGIEEGVALVAEHEGQVVASVLAAPQPPRSALHLVDLRVDYDLRRQGIGSVLLYRIIEEARQRSLRAVTAATLTNNVPAGQFLHKAGFDLAGLDVMFHSNHDLVKESVTLFWYLLLGR